jgi:CBS-domain-containing membrane protein
MAMQAQDVMTIGVTTIGPDAQVREAAVRMLERGVSALPVVDDRKLVLGIVSEGDLVRRTELGTDGTRSWWLRAFAADAATDYLKTHGVLVRDVMTTPVVSVTPETPLHQVARLIEEKRIKRVPVLEAGRLVGIVSRADLVRRLAIAPAKRAAVATTDRALKKRVSEEVMKTGVDTPYLNIIVENATVHFWGAVKAPAEQRALRAAAESIAGVRSVEDHTFVMPVRLIAAMGPQ